mgnify:CR=1 FL=1
MQGGGGITDGDSVAKVGTPTTSYAADTVDNRNVFYLDDGSGSGEQYLPRFTIFSGNTYRFNKYFSDKKKIRDNFLETINLFSANYKNIKNEWKRFNAIKEGVFLTRDLVSEPSNNLTPLLLSKEALKLRKTGLKVEQLDEKKLKQLKMGALLGVAQGSANKPYVVTLEWRGNKSKKK